MVSLPNPPRIWLAVRKVARLTILNRASYLALALVPIISAALPFIKNQVEATSTPFTDASEALSQEIHLVSQSIRDLPEGTEPCENLKFLESTLTRLGQRVSEFQKTAPYPAEIYLPWTLGSAFLAALLFVLGQLLFELGAPRQVKVCSRSEYVDRATQRYSDSSSPEVSKLADERLYHQLGLPYCASYRKRIESTVSGLLTLSAEECKTALPKYSEVELFELLDYADFSTSQTPAIANTFKPLKNSLQDEIQERFPEKDDLAQKKRLGAKIQRSSTLFYDSLSTKRMPLGFLALVLYSLAGYLILCIAIVQVLSVLSATGLNPVELMLPPIS